MNLYYVVPETVFHEPFANHTGRITSHRFDLFQGQRNIYLPLANGLVLLMIEDTGWHPTSQGNWHSHPEVARLPHPEKEATVTFGDAMKLPHKQLQQKHLDALNAKLKILPTHTITDLHNALIAGGWHSMGLSQPF